MKIEGTQKLDAPLERVYAALIDPEVLQRCIPGCESLVKTSEDSYAVTIRTGIGMIKGTFKGNVHLEDMRPPEHYRITVDGKGGPGFLKGSGDFDLEESDGGTLIKYTGELQVGGAIAGIGQRMVEGAAKMMASRFFNSLEAEAKGSAPEVKTGTASNL
ncbi:MAG: SRPBCC family protein [Acidobacteriota bacterium]